MTTNEQELPFRTATETMISAMDELGQSEGKSVIIIFTNVDGDIIVKGNTGKCLALGLIENAKHLILTGQI